MRFLGDVSVPGRPDERALGWVVRELLWERYLRSQAYRSSLSGTADPHRVASAA